MQKKSVLEEIRKIQNNVKNSSDDFTSHLVIGIDTDENGYPESTMTMTSAKPIELIGMCTHMISVLKDIRKNVVKKLKPSNNNPFPKITNAEEFEKALKDLPDDLANKLRAFKKRMDNAIESGNDNEIKKLKDEITSLKDPFFSKNNFKNNDEDDDENNDFNINDFK
jgi:hypothetical protein